MSNVECPTGMPMVENENNHGHKIVLVSLGTSLSISHAMAGRLEPAGVGHILFYLFPTIITKHSRFQAQRKEGTPQWHSLSKRSNSPN